MTKKKYKKLSLDAENYVNIGTGELLSSEIGTDTLSGLREDGTRIVRFKSFTIHNKEAISYLKEKLNRSNMAVIYEMIDMCQGLYNIIHKQGKRVEKSMVSDIFGYSSRDKCHLMLKTLHRLNVISYFVDYCHTDNKSKYYIMLNPYISNMGNPLHDDIFKEFQPIVKFKTEESFSLRRRGRPKKENEEVL